MGSSGEVNYFRQIKIMGSNVQHCSRSGAVHPKRDEPISTLFAALGDDASSWPIGGNL